MENSNPKPLSIITINFNNLEGLKRTVESVIQQTWQDFEYIIIDGGSTDGSAEYIREMQQHFDYWVSERDKGIYNAMNKGIKVARGDYIFFVNSGDTLVSNDCLEIAVAEANLKVMNRIYYGGGYLTRNGVVDREITVPEIVTLSQFYFSSVPHSAMSFICRQLLLKHNLYDESVKYCSDWLFFLDRFIEGVPYIKIRNTKLGVFEADGASYSPEAMRERFTLLQERKHLFLDSIELKKLREKAFKKRVKRVLKYLKGAVKIDFKRL